MTPQSFDGFNAIYRGTAELPCEDLPAKRTDKAVITRWRPTQAELQALLNGGSIELTIFGGQPPVALRVV